MNERIRELAREAAGGLLDYTAEGEWKLSQNEAEKFAQLIVKECVGIVDNAERGGSNDVWDNAVKFIRRDLKEHFGVEE